MYKNQLFNNRLILFSLLLGDCLTTTSYSWDGCQFISEDDTIKFKITVVDEYKNERSKVENKKLTLPEILLHLMVDCTSNDVITDWKLTSYPYNIDEYCLKYWCGSVNKETVGYRFHVRGGGTEQADQAATRAINHKNKRFCFKLKVVHA